MQCGRTELGVRNAGWLRTRAHTSFQPLLAALLLLSLPSASAQEAKQNLCSSDCLAQFDTVTCRCLCLAWENTGADLSPLADRVVRSVDDQGYNYVIKLCGVVVKEDVPSECRLDVGTQPSVVRYQPGSPVGCEVIGMVEATEATRHVDNTVDVILPCQHGVRGSRNFVLVLVPADADQDPGRVRAAAPNDHSSDAPCDSYSASWPTTAVGPASEGDDGTCGEINALYITGPFFLVLAVIAIVFMRNAKAGTGGMPFGLPNMTSDQLSVFALCYLTYALYHALRAGFSGCKSSMVSESGFSKTQMGNMDTGFLLLYGAGQFFWGSRADQVSPKLTTVNGMYSIAGVVILCELCSSACIRTWL